MGINPPHTVVGYPGFHFVDAGLPKALDAGEFPREEAVRKLLARLNALGRKQPDRWLAEKAGQRDIVHHRRLCEGKSVAFELFAARQLVWLWDFERDSDSGKKQAFFRQERHRNRCPQPEVIFQNGFR